MTCPRLISPPLAQKYSSRMAVREQVLLAGVTAFGVISGLALSNNERRDLLGMCPFLSFAFAVLFFRLHFLMAHPGPIYPLSELDPYLDFSDAKEVGRDRGAAYLLQHFRGDKYHVRAPSKLACSSRCKSGPGKA